MNEERVIPVERVRPLVEGWLAKFPSREEGLQVLASSSPYPADTWRKRLTALWTPSKRRPPGGIGPVQAFPLGWWAQKKLTVSEVDEVLTAADLQYLWRVELSEFTPDAGRLSDEEHDHTCGECGSWIDWEKGALGVRIELKPNQKGKWRMWWSLCAICAARTLPIELPDGLPGIEKGGAYSRAARLTSEDVRELYLRYVRDGHSLVTLAEEVWEQYGYRNVTSCQASLGKAFRRNGLPIRSIVASREANKKAGRRPIVNGRLTDRELRAAYELYWKQHLSFNQLGKLMYERYGYADYRTCATALCTGFKRLGLPARGRIEATVMASTKHGLAPRDRKLRAKLRKEAGLTSHRGVPLRPKCTATTHKGKRCGRKAMLDQPFCTLHDPNMPEERRVRLEAQKRAQSARASSQLVDGSELVALLRAHGGTPYELRALTGIGHVTIAALLNGERSRVKERTLEKGLRAFRETPIRLHSN